ncbi:MAG: sigma 54-interacting transcriptional regulator [Myxococcales bacterium]|nr:sigma 54-interacting transcriptional regulator [Myxococcales bacterium]
MRLADRYRVLRRVGEGGGGGVWLVEDRLADDAVMVLKRLHAQAHQGLAQWLVNEFQILAQLDLPTIARVHDFGLASADAEDPGGSFFTRAFVDGAPLDEALSGLDPQRLRAALVSTASTLRALHRLGVVHGDLKPANLIVPVGGDRPQLIDFGLAHGALGAVDHVRGGTLGFLTPERQAQLLSGEALLPDPRADVYALAMSFRCVLARAPTPPGPEAGLPAELSARPALVALWEVLSRAVAHDPARRIASMDDLLAALAVGREGDPHVEARVVLRPEGRETELGALLDAVGRRLLQRETAVPVVLLAGDEGSGRTTLLRELSWRAQLRGVQTLSLRGAPGEAMARRLREGAQILSGMAVDTEVPDALATALRRAAANAPVLLLVDDLDRADPGVAGLLRSIAYGCEREEPLLVIATSERSESVRELDPAQVVTLGPLDESAVTALCTQILGAVEPAVVRTVYRRTGALPLAVTEMLMALARDAAVTPSDVERAEVPSGASGAAVRRVEPLAPQVRWAAAMAVALGQDATVEALRLAEVDPAALEMARAAGVLVLSADARLRAVSSAMESAVLSSLGAERLQGVRQRAAEVLEITEASASARAMAWLRAGAPSRARTTAAEAVASLRRAGLPAAAARMLGALREADPGAVTAAERFEEADLLAEAGRIAEAEALLGPLGETAMGPRAGLLLGRLRRVAGDVAASQAVLEPLTRDPDLDPDLAAEALVELARAAMPQGDYLSVKSRSLAAASRARSPRVRALAEALAGIAAVYAGDAGEGNALLERATASMATLSLPKEEAALLVYLAVARERLGELPAARSLHEKSLDRARAAGDLRAMVNARINLGHIAQRMGDLGAALEHDQAALKLAQRAGIQQSVLYARLNAATQLLRIGSLDRARVEIDAAERLATQCGARDMAASARLASGVAWARSGDLTRGLSEIGLAETEFRALGQLDEVADAKLDAAEIVLDRGAQGDLARASELVAAVRALAGDALGDKSARVKMIEGRAQLGRGELRGALETLNASVAEAETQRDWEVLSGALAARARVHVAMGAELHARRDRERALEVLEEKAALLPPDLRGAFWSVSSRASLRDEAVGRQGEAAPGRLWPATGLTAMGALRTGMGTVNAPTLMASDERVLLLVELSRRLGEEDSLERVLQLAVRSAVELTGAERGAVLLAGASGQLEIKAREGGARGDGPDDQFSRSIAETVWIDGEAVVTLDARGDRRFADFRSVHELNVSAVAAVPIRFRGRVLGVLYVESRRRRGQWAPSDVALMTAFAEQAAIAVEHWRVVEELEARTQELERARVEIETLLESRTHELEATRSSLERAQEALGRRFTLKGLIGHTEAMRRVFALIERLRDSDVSVVVEGESGTGKELIARALHFSGNRAKGPFVVVHCGAIPESLIESELFGHVRGAFTGADRDRKGLIASAHGGTLMLDEVSEMSPRMQVELLRVLQDRKVRPVGGDHDESIDVRVVAAGNRPLQEMVSEGRFREDLYYRLAVVTVRVPPLRERAEDIPALAAHFLAGFADDQAGPRKRLSREALQRLVRAPWPGNVRQLRHVLESAVVLVEGEVIEADALGLADDARSLRPQAPQASHGAGGGGGAPQVASAEVDAESPEGGGSLTAARRASERARIVDALERANWNKVRAADLLGMPRRTLYRRLKEYGLLD